VAVLSPRRERDMRAEFEDNDKREVIAMTIEIHKPELEALIRSHIESGQSVEDVLWQALTSGAAERKLAPAKGPHPESKKSLAQLFAESPFKGLDMDFERFPDILPPVL
jgi:hypothetical protein